MGASDSIELLGESRGPCSDTMLGTPQYKRDRCVTGVHGLDEILRGGIPYVSTLLVCVTCV